MGKEKKQKRSAIQDVVTRIHTINLHKSVHGKGFKKRAPQAIKAIRAFATNAMGTKDVRLDSKLNKQVWSGGIRHVPRRIRVSLARKRNDDEDAKEKLYTLVSLIPDVILTKSYRAGVVTQTLDD